MRTLLIAASLAAFAFCTPVMADSLSPREIVDLVNTKQILSFDQLDKIATDLHSGSTITETDLKDNYGRLVYDVELKKGSEKWEVHLDPKTGEVLRDKMDD